MWMLKLTHIIREAWSKVSKNKPSDIFQHVDIADTTGLRCNWRRETGQDGGSASSVVERNPLTIYFFNVLLPVFFGSLSKRRWAGSCTHRGVRIQVFFSRVVKVAKMLLSFCAGVIWVLWKTSNDHVFDNKIVPIPMMGIHKAVSTLKQWSLLVR